MPGQRGISFVVEREDLGILDYAAARPILRRAAEEIRGK